MTEKILLDTSCALAAVAGSLLPEISRQLPNPDGLHQYWTSQYLRMEFLRRWIVTGIRLYFVALRKGTIEKAAAYMMNEFGTREVKAIVFWQAEYSASKYRKQTQLAQEEIEQFGRLVYRTASNYDNLCAKHTEPKTGCKRGQITFDYHGSTMREVLRDFHQRFTDNGFGCHLADWLEDQGRFEPLLKAAPEQVPKNSSKAYAALMTNLRRLMASPDKVTCLKCGTIGDVIIALEQPNSWVLYHLDYSFDALCQVLGKPHKKLRSTYSVSPKKEVFAELEGAN